MVRGAYDVMDVVKKNLGVAPGGTTDDELFTLTEVECLGSCPNAPMVQINDDYYEDLDADSTNAVLDALRAGKKPTPGPQNGRNMSEGILGRTTLTTPPAGPHCTTL